MKSWCFGFRFFVVLNFAFKIFRYRIMKLILKELQLSLVVQLLQLPTDKNNKQLLIGLLLNSIKIKVIGGQILRFSYFLSV